MATQQATSGPRPKTAVVVIHGIGEQRPLETIKAFVETVYRHDRTLASRPVGPNGMLDVSVVPDSVTGSAELRRITTLDDGPRSRTDFFEFYWADIMDGTPVDMVTGWIRTLLLRSPWRLPKAVKVQRAWWALLLAAVLIVAAGFVAVYPVDIGKAWPIDWLGGWLFLARPYVAGVLAIAGLAIFALRAWRTRNDRRELKLGVPLGLLLGGVVLWAIPDILAASLRFWAGALTFIAGWGLNALITPYAGDVVRYVRATPSTVERRRLVRERGVALFEALHRKRLDGSDLDDFTAATEKQPPLYERIVLVGHSLGTIVAYDVLQLFWERYGPTHHRDWVAADPNVQAALAESDKFVQMAWADPPVSFSATAFEQSQDKLFALVHDDKPRWRISDLITLGSPLTHAEFLLADSPEEMQQAFAERRFATSPPRPDPSQSGSMLFRGKGPKGPLYPHFAAQFAAVKWTNIHDENAHPLFGDLISGKLTEFGAGIRERDLPILRPRGPAFLRRAFTHTRYWHWDESYEPSQASIDAAAEIVDDDKRLRELLWENVPAHITELRLALKLGVLAPRPAAEDEQPLLP